MKCKREALQLYAVTDRRWTGRQTLDEQVAAALCGGATCVQLREKTLCEADFLAQAHAIRALCRTCGVPFLVNDNVDIALACGADGVHVGQHDLSAGAVRARTGDALTIGVSARTVAEAVAAESAGADYLGVGAIFSTATKADARPVSLETLKAICTAVTIPVVAIGGITRENLPQLCGTGIAGAALVSAIFAAGDIAAECRVLRALMRQII